MALPRTAIEMGAFTRPRFQRVRLPVRKNVCKDFFKKNADVRCLIAA
jgi:hypothetical protein